MIYFDAYASQIHREISMKKDTNFMRMGIMYVCVTQSIISCGCWQYKILFYISSKLVIHHLQLIIHNPINQDIYQYFANWLQENMAVILISGNKPLPETILTCLMYLNITWHQAVNKINSHSPFMINVQTRSLFHMYTRFKLHGLSNRYLLHPQQFSSPLDHISYSKGPLTCWSWDKMGNILQTTFSNIFSLMKILNFH